MAERDRVFFSYRHDKQGERWVDLILRWLEPYALGDSLQVWSDRDIRTAELWDSRILAAIDRARVAVLLVNQTFFGSGYITQRELPRLLQAAHAGDLALVCVPVGPSDRALRERHGLESFQFTHSPDEPLSDTTGGQRERWLTEVAMKIHGAFGRPPPRLGRPGLASGRAGEALLERRLPAAAGALGALFDVPPLDDRHLIPRPEVIDTLCSRLMSGKELAHGVIAAPAGLGLHGMGGMGKTVTAQVLAHDARARSVFADGIAWVALGQQPDLLNLQNRLLRQLAPGTAPATSAAEARGALRAALQDRRVLIVVDDIWDARHFEAFDVVGASGRLLLTTRDASVLAHVHAVPLQLERMPHAAALQLLARWAGIGIAELPPAAGEVVEHCGGLPLALALAGAQVAEGVGWNSLAQQLREGRLRFLDHPYGSVYESIGRSVDALPNAERARYLELAVFSEDAAVPVLTVQRLWALSGLDAAESERLLVRLARRSLLALQGAGQAARLSLHDLQHDFLRARCDDLQSLHGRLLAAHRLDHALPRGASGWARMPVDEPYLWPHLAGHLAAAGLGAELEQSLLDIGVLQARLRSETTDVGGSPRADVAALRADFATIDAASPARLVGDALHMSGHVLRERPGELALQLFGRLGAAEQPALRELAQACRRVGSAAALLPLRSALQPPGPLELMLNGHGGPVEGALMLPDGRRVLSWSTDRSLRLWDLERGETLQVFEGHERAPEGALLLPDGRRMLTWAADCSLRLWDIETGRALQVCELDKAATPYVGASGAQLVPGRDAALAWHGRETLWLCDLATGAVLDAFVSYTGSIRGALALPDGRRALSWSEDGALAVWDLVDDRAAAIDLSGHEAAVSGVLLLPDGQRALSWSVDGTVRLWDLQRGEQLSVLAEHRRAVSGACLLDQGRRVLWWTGDGGLQLWDLAQGRSLASMSVPEPLMLRGVVVLPDEQQAFAWSVGGAIWLWDLDRAQLAWKLDTLSEIRGACALPGGRQLLLWAGDGSLRLIDVVSGQLQRSLRGHESQISSVLALPGGERVLSSSADGTLRLWNLTRTRQVPAAPCHGDWVVDALLLPGARRALSCSADGSLRLWGLEQGEALRSMPGHDGLVAGMLLLPDGRRVLSWSHDGTLRLWDAERGEPLHLLSGHGSRVVGALLLPDGEALSWSHDGTLRRWDLEQGRAQTVATAHPQGVRGVSLLGDGTRALSWTRSGRMCVWDLKRGTLLRSVDEVFPRLGGVLASPDGLLALAWAEYGAVRLCHLQSGGDDGSEIPELSLAGARAMPDAWQVLGRSRDGTLSLWDFRQRKCVCVLQAHATRVSGALPLADGQRVLSWAARGELRLWDLAGSSLLREFHGHQGRIGGALPLSGEGHLLSWSDDRTLRLWGLANGKQLGVYSHDSSISTVVLTPDNRRAFVGDWRGGVQILELQVPQQA